MFIFVVKSLDTLSPLTPGYLDFQVVEVYGTQMEESFIVRLLNPESLILMPRLSEDQMVIRELLKLYHAILCTKSVALVQEAYRCDSAL